MGTSARVWGVAATAAGLLMLAVPASAGGWWTYIELDKDPIAVGETVTATAQISSPVPTQEEASGYHAYLVRGVDRDALDEAMTAPRTPGWWTPPSTTIRLAELELSGQTRATATFTIPDVEPGLYGLMFCSAECAEPLADVIPLLDVAVHGDALLAHSIRTLGNDPMTESHLTLIEDRVGVLSEQVQDLRREVSSLLDAPPAPAPSPMPSVSPEATPAAASVQAPPTVPEQHWIAVAAAFLAGAALAGMVASLRHRRRRSPVPGQERIVEADPAPVPEPVGSVPE